MITLAGPGPATNAAEMSRTHASNTASFGYSQGLRVPGHAPSGRVPGGGAGEPPPVAPLLPGQLPGAGGGGGSHGGGGRNESFGKGLNEARPGGGAGAEGAEGAEGAAAGGEAAGAGAELGEVAELGALAL